jgi:hypothetical protein
MRLRLSQEREHSAADGVCIEASVPQPVRHPDARRFVQSGAGEQDRPVARELVQQAGDLIWRDPASSLEGKLVVPVPPHVHEESALGDELPGFLGLDSAGRAPDGRR